MVKLSIFMSNYVPFKNDIDTANSESLTAVINYSLSKHQNTSTFSLYRPFYKFPKNIEKKNCIDINTALLKNDSWASLISTKYEMQKDNDYFLYVDSSQVLNKDFNISAIIEQYENEDIDIFFHNNLIDFNFFIIKKSAKMFSFIDEWYKMQDTDKDLGAVMKKYDIKHKVLTQKLASFKTNDEVTKMLIRENINYNTLANEILQNCYKEYDTDKVVFTDKKLKVLIGTPCFGAQVSCNYTKCLISTLNLFKEYGIECHVSFIPNQIVTRARNLIAQEFMVGNYSHLFFIDADIEWNPDDALKLIKHNKDIIIGLYANKSYIVNEKREVQGNLYNALQYSTTFLGAVANMDKDKLMQVKYGATGFMCIKRHVFEKLMPTTEYYLHNSKTRIYDFFPCRVVNKEYLTEDYYFCKIWRDLNSETNHIYADLTIKLNHEGWHSYRGDPLKTFTIL